jgi:uncharacterized LabA/DUF88 family protein
MLKNHHSRHSGRTDPDAPRRQQIYLDALKTVPSVQVHFGMFLVQQKFSCLFHPPAFRPRLAEQLLQPWPDVVKVYKTEEKGSDVNLASHLLFDAFRDRFDVAAVLSNDSDLVEPIRLVAQEMGKPVDLLSPVENPNPKLLAVSSFVRRIRPDHLRAVQFANPIIREDGSELSKPAQWIDPAP